MAAAAAVKTCDAVPESSSTVGSPDCEERMLGLKNVDVKGLVAFCCDVKIYTQMIYMACLGHTHHAAKRSLGSAL